MEYIALKESYGFGGRYLKEGDTVIITDEEKADIDEAYFNALFKAVHAEESVDEKPKRRTATNAKSKE